MDEIEAFERYMRLPETNEAVMKALYDQFMAPADYVAEMKLQAVLWREVADA
jgi:hypothetical protein